MITQAMVPMMMPVEPFDSTSTANAPINNDGGGGETFATVGSITTASTAIGTGTPVTLASMAVALLGLLVALAIVDCTEAAVAVVVWMLTPTRTLPGDMVSSTDIVSSTATESTPARVAIAPFIWARTLGVNEETSPASRRANPTILIAGGEGTGDGGGGDGNGGGGDGDGGGEGKGEGGGGDSDGGGGEGDGGGGEGGGREGDDKDGEADGGGGNVGGGRWDGESTKSRAVFSLLFDAIATGLVSVE